MVTPIKSLLDHRIEFDDYLIGSTLASVFMMIVIGQAGIDLYLGYPLLVLNTAILLVADRLAIHRNHIIALCVLAGFGTAAAIAASTPATAGVAQLAGITIMSVYYFNALTGFGVPIARWMDNYARMAFYVAICGLLQWAIWRVLHLGDGRLKGFYSEPSVYVFTILPALGYFANIWMTQRRYGTELLVVLASFVCAESSLGFLGILLIVILIMTHRMKMWQIVLGTVLVTVGTAAIYLASANFRLRVNDTVMAAASQDLTGTNASTFALLSNAYVAWHAFLDHPLTGVGLGGYQFIYVKYIIGVTGSDPTLFGMNLNMYDANSMILRVAAELGLPGLIGLFGFVIVCARVKGEQHRLIRNAILPYLVIRIGRLGAYFTMELYFFVGLYLMNYLESRRSVAKAVSIPARPV